MVNLAENRITGGITVYWRHNSSECINHYTISPFVVADTLADSCASALLFICRPTFRAITMIRGKLNNFPELLRELIFMRFDTMNRNCHAYFHPSSLPPIAHDMLPRAVSFSPKQPDFPGAAATGGGSDAVAPAATRLQQVAQVEDPVCRDGEGSKSVIFQAVNIALLATRRAAAFCIGQHRLQTITINYDRLRKYLSSCSITSERERERK